MLNVGESVQRIIEIIFSLKKNVLSVLQPNFTGKKQVIEQLVLKKSIKRGDEGKLNVYRQLFLIMRDTGTSRCRK